MGIGVYKPTKKPLLNKKIKLNPLNWAKEKKNWTVEDCQNVIFSYKK